MEESRGSEGAPSRRLSRTFTAGNFDIMDPEVVPSSLAAIAPILRVANEIEDKSPRVAYLCRFYAFDKAHKMDQTSSGRGVRQFKTALLHKLEKDDEPTRHTRVHRSDAREMQNYYERFYNQYVKSLETAGENMDRAQLAKAYQTASVLFDVLKAVNQNDDEQVITKEEEDKFAKELEKKTKKYGSFNILPLDPDDKEREKGVPIMSLNEVMAAVNAIRNIRGLDGAEKETIPIHDILDWLQLKFGFQKDNVANQRENLILLLANVHVRISEDYPPSDKLDDEAVDIVYQRLFKNYVTWCKFIGRPSSLILPKIQPEQRKLLYMALFLLIWGEAANLRFMPESLCYIFHHMARELHGLLDGKVSTVTGESVLPAYGGETNAFLDKVIKPIYDIVAEEVTRYKDTKVRHSTWRNYDDLNEYFWSSDCFRLGWPMRTEDNFFRIPESSRQKNKDGRQSPWYGKSGFVEVRSFWHIFRSFDRMWSFLILSLQAMVIVAWNGSGRLGDIFKPDVFKKVLSILITSAFLRLVQAIVDVFLSIGAWRSMNWTGILRYILKVVFAFAWVIILPLCYARTWGSPIGLLSAFESWFGNTGSPSLYVTAILIYLAPDAFGAILFFFPSLRRTMEKVNHGFVKFLLWWSQQPLYIGRGMHENPMTLFMYTFFWILLLISKLLFSYYVEILPLIRPTKDIMEAPVEGEYQWHEFFPYAKYNIGVIVSIWSPIILVYFMDTQIWYSLMSTVWGGITGAFSRLGEIRSVEMLRSRFQFLPSAFNENLIPSDENEKPTRKKFSLRKHYESFLDDNVSGNGFGKEQKSKYKLQFARFSLLWNEVIQSLREEDYISNGELELLTIPRTTDPLVNYLQWPPFLLANKIVLALDTVKDFTSEMRDEELMKRFENDKLIVVAIRESYDLLKTILTDIITHDNEKAALQNLIKDVEDCVASGEVLQKFRMNAMPVLHQQIVNLVHSLNAADPSNRHEVSFQLQNVVEAYQRDVREEGSNLDISDPSYRAGQKRKTDGTSLRSSDRLYGLFGVNSFQYPPPKHLSDKIKRLLLLLSANESGMDIPVNREARRRISYFTNSLFMDMPQPRKIPRMRSFSVLTPYYDEEILYTKKALQDENEDGVSILFYLQKIYPDEWKNFKQRENINNDEENLWESEEAVRRWASYRAQTLTRTVRGMMYYRRAIKLLAFFDLAKNDSVIMQGYNASQPTDSQMHSQNIDSITDLKFTYVVSCQRYGIQRRSGQEKAHNILNLMKENPSLRVAYIDEVDEKDKETTYYSKLVKVIKDDTNNATEQEIYSIKLPGNPILGEGKPENQNHAIIFTRGEALQAIDMNQDHYLEEALKMRNLLEEFSDEKRGPSVLGMREHIFTGSVSSLANFMSKQESSFVTIGQRVLANPLKVRFHYGHPDVFERLFHITRGGISKASKGINLSEDIFAGFNTTLRGGNVTHHEYIQVGKGRDVGLNQISLFEAKIANGNGEQTISRDVYRLGHRMDFFRMLSVYYTTVGFYFSNLIIVLTVYIFLYGRIYLALSGLDASLTHFAGLENNTSLQAALASQSFVQIGLLTALPMVMEIGLERGFRKAFSDFVIMQLQLASVFFTFSMGTKVHFYGRTILHGGAKYRSTGRGFVVFHAKFADNYRLYSRSHFTKGIELLILLIVYDVYGTTVNKTIPYLLITFSLWFLVGTWLFAPFLFNPSGFEWQKIVDDWDDWTKWVNNRGGIGVAAEKSWESWWIQEHEHVRTSGFRGHIIEILLATRFLLYQYGLVYHLNIANHNKSIMVYALSWLVIIVLLLLLKGISEGRRMLSADFQLFFRLIKGAMFVTTIAIFAVFFLIGNLTIGDIFAGLLAFLPSGWAVIQIAQVCYPIVKKIGMWESVMSLARSYEYIMGFVLFAPVAILAWFPFISDFQTRLLFNQAFSRGLQISRILAGRKDKKNN